MASPSNSDILRGIYEAFAEGDVPAVLAALSPEVEWVEAEGFPYGGVYRGPGAVLHGVFMKLGSEWEGFSAVPEGYVADGDTVVVLGTYSGTYVASGRRFQAPFAHVWWIEDGKVIKFHQHTDTKLVSDAMEG